MNIVNVDVLPVQVSPPAYSHACIHCGQFLDKGTWEKHCPILTAGKPVGILHAFVKVRKAS